MSKRSLTPLQAGEIRRLRAEVNDWGEPKWTGAEIARAIGCSESTVWRVIGQTAAYGKPRPTSGMTMELAAASLAVGGGDTSALDSAAEASMKRLQERLARPAPKSALDDDEPADAAEPSEGLSALQRTAAKYGLDIEKLRSGK